MTDTTGVNSMLEPEYLRSRYSFTDLEKTFKDWSSLICEGNSLNIQCMCCKNIY